MSSRRLRESILHFLATRLRALASRLEVRARPAKSKPDNGTDASPPLSQTEEIVAAFPPSAASRPPEHWLAKVRQHAPHLLEVPAIRPLASDQTIRPPRPQSAVLQKEKSAITGEYSPVPTNPLLSTAATNDAEVTTQDVGAKVPELGSAATADEAVEKRKAIGPQFDNRSEAGGALRVARRKTGGPEFERRPTASLQAFAAVDGGVMPPVPHVLADASDEPASSRETLVSQSLVHGTDLTQSDIAPHRALRIARKSKAKRGASNHTSAKSHPVEADQYLMREEMGSVPATTEALSGVLPAQHPPKQVRRPANEHPPNSVPPSEHRLPDADAPPQPRTIFDWTAELPPPGGLALIDTSILAPEDRTFGNGLPEPTEPSGPPAEPETFSQQDARDPIFSETALAELWPNLPDDDWADVLVPERVRIDHQRELEREQMGVDPT